MKAAADTQQHTPDDGGAAFPGMAPNPPYHVSGMTLRDYFAGQALTGFVGNPEVTAKFARYDYAESQREIADGAYRMADAMLAARAPVSQTEVTPPVAGEATQ